MDEEPECPGWRAGVLGAVGRGSTAACLPGGPSCPGPLWVECTKGKDQNQAQEGEAGSQGSVRPEVKCAEETASRSQELCRQACRGASVSGRALSRALLLRVTL